MPTKKTVITEEFSQTKQDHDTLIRVETKLDLVMGQSLPSLANDIKELREGLVARILVLEAWKEKEDSYHAAIPLKVYDDNSQWVSGFRSNIKLIGIVITAISSLAGAALGISIPLLFHFK